jgi:hypothetical protein
LEADGTSASWREPASTAIFDRRADTSRESSPAMSARPCKYRAHGAAARPRKGILRHAYGGSIEGATVSPEPSEPGTLGR